MASRNVPGIRGSQGDWAWCLKRTGGFGMVEEGGGQRVMGRYMTGKGRQERRTVL